MSTRPEPDADFDWYVSCLPAKHWSKYDLSAVRQGWDAHKAFKRANPTEPVANFKQWYDDHHTTTMPVLWRTDIDLASRAWNYQQQYIDDLQAQVTHLEARAMVDDEGW